MDGNDIRSFIMYSHSTCQQHISFFNSTYEQDIVYKMLRTITTFKKYFLIILISYKVVTTYLLLNYYL